jgi:ketosteroid isomerase-like protein
MIRLRDTPGAMAPDHVHTVRRLFESWASGDLSAYPELFDEHVTFVVSSDFPAWGVHHGRDGVRRYMLDFLAQFEQTTFEAKRLRAAGDTVLVHVLQRGRGRTSGLEADISFFMLFTFQGSRIVRFDTLMDETDAHQAAGLRD